jgi:hypothetical protein
MPNISIRIPSNKHPGPFTIFPTCDQHDCKFYRTEVEGVNWNSTVLSGEAMDSVMMYPYVFINETVVIDVRCSFCSHCKKFDMKKEIQVAQAFEVLSGNNS